MGLIEGWTHAARLWTVRILSIDIALQLAEVFIPAFADAIPRQLYLGLTVACLIARVVRQPKVHDA